MFTSSRTPTVFFWRCRSGFSLCWRYYCWRALYGLRLEDKGVSYFRWGFFRLIAAEHRLFLHFSLLPVVGCTGQENVLIPSPRTIYQLFSVALAFIDLVCRGWSRFPISLSLLLKSAVSWVLRDKRISYTLVVFLFCFAFVPQSVDDVLCTHQWLPAVAVRED